MNMITTRHFGPETTPERRFRVIATGEEGRLAFWVANGLGELYLDAPMQGSTRSVTTLLMDSGEVRTFSSGAVEEVPPSE